MTGNRTAFRSFAAIRIAVSEFDSAVSAWRDQLGWAPCTVSADLAVFLLDDASIEMVPAAAGQVPGVTAVAVTAEDTAAAARRVRSAGLRAELAPDGTVTLSPQDLNGIALELRRYAAASPRASPGPFTRVNHVVVAVEDDDAALANWARAFGRWPPHALGGHEHVHHVPVGDAWFGLTTAGTDAGALRRFVDRRGEGVYAVGLVVGDWAATVEALQRNGARLIESPASNQTFVHPSTTHGMLIEVMAEWHPARLPAR